MTTEKLWVDLPLRAQKIANTLTDVLLDGFYLAAFPKLSVLLHFLVLVAGLLSGWLHPGFKTVFSESMPFMIAAGAIGILSARLGLLLVISFALGDFFLASHSAFYVHGFIRSIWEVQAPLFIEYALLGMLLIGIPITAKQILATFRPPNKLSDTQLVFVGAGFMAAFTGLLVFFWSQAVPVLMRPVFLWSGYNLPVAMAAPLQTQWYIPVAVFSLAAFVRVWIQYSVEKKLGLAKTLASLREKLFNADPVVPLTAKIPVIPLSIISSLWIVFLLSGMITNWIQALILTVVFSLFAMLREGVVKLPLGKLPIFVHRTPYIVRFIVGMLLVIWVANTAISKRSYNDEFEAVIITVALAAAIFFLLNPPRFEEEEGV